MVWLWLWLYIVWLYDDGQIFQFWLLFKHMFLATFCLRFLFYVLLGLLVWFAVGLQRLSLWPTLDYIYREVCDASADYLRRPLFLVSLESRPLDWAWQRAVLIKFRGYVLIRLGLFFSVTLSLIGLDVVSLGRFYGCVGTDDKILEIMRFSYFLVALKFVLGIGALLLLTYLKVWRGV